MANKIHGWYLVTPVSEGRSGTSVKYWNGEKWLETKEYAWDNPEAFDRYEILASMGNVGELQTRIKDLEQELDDASMELRVIGEFDEN